METTTPDSAPANDPPIPSPPPFAAPIDLEADEIDVDLGDEEHRQLRHDTIPEKVIYLGRWDSLESYFKSQLQDLVDSSVHWALDCLDWGLVQERFETDGSRHFCEAGQVFKVGGEEA